MTDPGRLKQQSKIVVAGRRACGVVRKGSGGDNGVRVDGGSTNTAGVRGGTVNRPAAATFSGKWVA